MGRALGLALRNSNGRRFLRSVARPHSDKREGGDSRRRRAAG